MKLSKSLLKAIAIGVTVGTAASCVGSLNETLDPTKTVQEVNEVEQCGETTPWGDCPACGMG